MLLLRTSNTTVQDLRPSSAAVPDLRPSATVNELRPSPTVHGRRSASFEKSWCRTRRQSTVQDLQRQTTVQDLQRQSPTTVHDLRPMTVPDRPPLPTTMQDDRRHSAPTVHDLRHAPSAYVRAKGRGSSEMASDIGLRSPVMVHALRAPIIRPCARRRVEHPPELRDVLLDAAESGEAGLLKSARRVEVPGWFECS